MKQQDKYKSNVRKAQELITTKELCKRLKVSPGTLHGWRCLGMPHYNLNPLRGFRPTLRYDFDMVMSWIDKKFLSGKKNA